MQRRESAWDSVDPQCDGVEGREQDGEREGAGVRLKNSKTAYIMSTRAGETAGKLLFLKLNFVCQNKPRLPGRLGNEL